VRTGSCESYVRSLECLVEAFNRLLCAKCIHDIQVQWPNVCACFAYDLLLFVYSRAYDVNDKAPTFEVMRQRPSDGRVGRSSNHCARQPVAVDLMSLLRLPTTSLFAPLIFRALRFRW
jgi:hypothetical protein